MRPQMPDHHPPPLGCVQVGFAYIFSCGFGDFVLIERHFIKDKGVGFIALGFTLFGLGLDNLAWSGLGDCVWLNAVSNLATCQNGDC